MSAIVLVSSCTFALLLCVFPALSYSMDTAAAAAQQQQQQQHHKTSNAWMLPHYYKRLLASSLDDIKRQHVPSEEMKQPKCLAFAASCTPWHSTCCAGLECLSFSREMCMNAQDSCACLPASYRMRQVSNDLWYRRRR